MVENDPYQPPAAELRAPVQLGPEGESVASREARLGAAIIDSLIIMALVVPLQWFMGMYENPASNTMLKTAGIGGAGFLFTLLIQGYFLATRAQSIGKIALKIKIVTLDGKNADIMRILFMRLLPVTIASMVPIVGGLLSLADALFIFREDQRCIHDHIAGTRVVNV